MVELEYHPDASDEVAKAFSWYARIAPEVDELSKLEFEHAEELVHRSPDSWATYLPETRGFRFQMLPFVLAYIIRGERILIVALAHTKRKPGYWPDRLEQ
ncbi:type II toxin-antitoxin system RelE/ParE family toxin [Rhodopirellula sp. SWK7]|uniref:type II toxin-antitoxin system RelE/ParE family toxin n=1 Tax=Rhodopirellula sp. SWK7 TaxID=595460 RepID=UPI0002BEF635|nr:type II toxin-antitoxin system RelE/ParE family toxin [Rhodopirellula sp. SWK7]EMI40830.1 Plasmid stabilization system [Rhodopirellula sp. SWK7]